MRNLLMTTLAAGILVASVFATAQGPRRENRDGPQSGSGPDAAVARLMAFDKNNDGKLTKDELGDERLLRLFDRADANKDGVVTKQELTAFFAKEASTLGEGRGGPPGGGGPGGGPGGGGPRGPRGGGPGDGPRGGGPGGPGDRGSGGPGSFGEPPQPGQILPAFMQNALRLTDNQKKQLAQLQQEVDAKLEKILTAEQRQQLSDMREPGPGEFGPPPSGGSPGDRRRTEAKKKNN